MTRKKLGIGGLSAARSTRSSSRFSVLEVTDEEFPTLEGTDNPDPEYIRSRLDAMDKRLKADANKLLGKTERVILDTAGKDAHELPAISPEKPLVQTTTNGLDKTLDELELIPANVTKDKAWTSLFKDNRDPSKGLKLRYIPPNGKSLDFSDRTLPTMVEMWGFCLVGFFTGKYPGLKAIYDLKSTWGVSCIIKTHEKGWVIFKFQNDEDRTRVLRGGSIYHLW
ncbi:unnamed protein product [Cuscuta epithymum]|uniref:DUF4283 domain-containing protein n=1 Tax=Cuscuta epithymum TaxID=186058 RepID=A0AAV0FU04_9ASTE|nr:unnamed protein product [Cuscuta epithymum]